MPVIKRNGITYGPNGEVILSKAEYDALPASKNTDNVDYFIYDYGQVLTIDHVYPIGSLYFTDNNVNPGTYLDGTTWVAVKTANECARIPDLTNVASGTTTEKSFSVTTTGNPVLLAFDADANPLAAAAVWFSLYIDRDGSRIATRTVQCSGGNSYNGDGGIVYLDKSVSAGSHTYKFTVYVGVGPISFQESGAAEAPCCTLVELGYPTGKYAWKRTV